MDETAFPGMAAGRSGAHELSRRAGNLVNVSAIGSETRRAATIFLMGPRGWRPVTCDRRGAPIDPQIASAARGHRARPAGRAPPRPVNSFQNGPSSMAKEFRHAAHWDGSFPKKDGGWPNDPRSYRDETLASNRIL